MIEIRDAIDRLGGIAQYLDIGMAVHVIADVTLDSDILSKLSVAIQNRAEQAVSAVVQEMAELPDAFVVVELSESMGTLRSDNITVN